MTSRIDGTAVACRRATRLGTALVAVTAALASASAGGATCDLLSRAATRPFGADGGAIATLPLVVDERRAVHERATAASDWGANTDSSPAAAASLRTAAANGFYGLLASPADRSAAIRSPALDRGDGPGDDGPGGHDRPTPTPLPASGWLLGSVLVGLVASRRPARRCPTAR